MGRNMEIAATGGNFSAGNLGELHAKRLLEYEGVNPADGSSFPGKVFLAESLKASGMELSFQVMPPNMGVPFFHKHHKNEEVYIVLKGDGEFRIDGGVVPVKEGSVVRIAPDGSRSWKNTGKEPMIMLCIQAVAGSLREFTGHDGYMS
ncbi:MAG: cupin domain-containing protein [Planctomycetota bacterium]|jgi:mannose-6-phosphate isomerase-like protein (cupin superfamily)|nr:cupin domain-containing protein [Planctomycetota bacterium]